MFAVAAQLTPSHASLLAFLEGIGAMEMMLVAVIGLLLFGGKGLPDMARTLGKVVREFKKATSSVEEEVKRVMDDEAPPPPKRKPPVRLSPPPPAQIAPAPAAEIQPPPSPTNVPTSHPPAAGDGTPVP